MDKILKLLAVSALFLVLNSCVDAEYDMSDVDMTVQVGGAHFSLPLGKTDTIRVKSLMSDLNVGLIKTLDDGSYAISMGDTIDFAAALPDFTEAINISSVLDHNETIPLNVPEFASAGTSYSVSRAITTPNIVLEFNHDIPFKLNLAGASDIKKLEKIIIRDALLSLGFDTGLPDLDTRLKMEITFPKMFLFDNERVPNHVFSVDQSLINGKFDINPGLEIFGLDLTGKNFTLESLEFDETISLKCTLTVLGSSLDAGIERPTSIRLGIKANLTEFSPVSATGLVDIAVDMPSQTLVLEGIPEFMKSEDCVLDLANPHISFELNSNAGLPVNGLVQIVPYIAGVEVADAKQSIPFKLPKALNSLTVAKIKYWLAKDKTSMPVDYEFIAAPKLANVFKVIPDSLVVSLSGGLDLDQSHNIEFEANYKAGAIYGLEVPFSFGPEFKIAMGDTIPDIPEMLSEMLNGAGLELTAKIENSLPLQLKLLISALDENDTEIPMTSTSNVITSCTSDGTSTKSDLVLNLKRTDTTTKTIIKALILRFEATSPDASNISIQEDDFLIADLSVKIPNGIVIDLSEEENDNK